MHHPHRLSDSAMLMAICCWEFWGDADICDDAGEQYDSVMLSLLGADDAMLVWLCYLRWLCGDDIG
jgi:hypothetical protein